MRNTRVGSWVVVAVFLAASAQAQDYVIVDGTLTDPVTDETTVLSGAVTLSPSTFDSDDSSDVYLIDDFDLQLGDLPLRPALPIEFMGESAFGELRIADQIHIEDDDVRFFYLRAGGEITSVVGDLVSFRTFEFEPTDYVIGGTYGEALGGVPPNRIELMGTLTQLDRTYRFREGSCPPIGGELPPIDGGGVIISIDSRTQLDQNRELTLHSFESFDLSGNSLSDVTYRSDGGATLNRVTGGDTSLSGGLIQPVEESQIIFVNPSGVVLGDAEIRSPSGATLTVAAATAVPLLEDLPIEAPDGATVTLDEAGELAVVSDGDIYLDGVFPDIAGVSSLYIEASNIFLETYFEVPDSIDTLTLHGRDSVVINGTIVAPSVDINAGTPPISPPCDIFIGGLRAVGPSDEMVLGTLVVTLSVPTTPMEIDVVPWRSSNRIYLGKRQNVWVALFGSDDLDVGDIDRNTLRLGPNDAKPRKYRRGSKKRRPMVFKRDWNRDGRPDLLTVFKRRKLGVEKGDTELCMSAQTHDGTVLEGCDEIQVVPKKSKRK